MASSRRASARGSFMQEKNRPGVAGATGHLSDGGGGGGDSLSIASPSSVYASATSTRNGCVLYAIFPSGPITYSDRLSIFRAGSYAPYAAPTFPSTSLPNTTGNSESFAQLASVVSGSTLMPITTTFRPLLKSVAY